jgi:hypothetical protein
LWHAGIVEERGQDAAVAGYGEARKDMRSGQYQENRRGDAKFSHGIHTWLAFEDKNQL